MFLSTVNFSWQNSLIPDATKIYLNYDLSELSWIISASTSRNWDNQNQFVIDVFPSCGYDDWGISTQSIKLCAKELNIHVFTSLWKAFEEKLTNATGKADLVQLSGYYQYNSRINGVMNFNSTSKINSFWRVVQCVTRCIGVSTQLTVQKCAECWGVKEEEIFSHLQSLRSIGYEVRSHNTNPQIPIGEYLIPYSFPTLNPKSVQLHKIL